MAQEMFKRPLTTAPICAIVQPQDVEHLETGGMLMNAQKPRNIGPPRGGCYGEEGVPLPRSLKRLIEIHALRSPAVFINAPAWYLTRQELELLETLRYWGY